MKCICYVQGLWCKKEKPGGFIFNLIKYARPKSNTIYVYHKALTTLVRHQHYSPSPKSSAAAMPENIRGASEVSVFSTIFSFAIYIHIQTYMFLGRSEWFMYVFWRTVQWICFVMFELSIIISFRELNDLIFIYVYNGDVRNIHTNGAKFVYLFIYYENILNKIHKKFLLYDPIKK